MGGLIYMEWKGCEFDTVCIKATLNFDLSHDVTLNFWIFKVKF